MFVVGDGVVAGVLDGVFGRDFGVSMDGVTRELVFTNSTTYVVIYANATTMYKYTKNLPLNSKQLNLFNFTLSLSCLTADNLANVCLTCSS